MRDGGNSFFFVCVNFRFVCVCVYFVRVLALLEEEEAGES